jgi:hypothetical protein
MAEEDLRNALLSLTSTAHPVLVTDHISDSVYSSDSWFQVNDKFNNGGQETVHIRSAMPNETMSQVFRNKLIRAATEAAMIDAAIVKVLKVFSSGALVEPPVHCAACNQVRSRVFYSVRQLAKDAPRCKPCLALAKKQAVPEIVDTLSLPADKVAVSVQKCLGSRIVLTQSMIGERIRRLIDEGYVSADSAGNVQYAGGDLVAPVAAAEPSAGTELTGRASGNVARVQRKISRQASVQAAPIRIDGQEVDALEAGGGELMRLISHAERLPDNSEQQYRNEITQLPETLDRVEFVSRDVLLHDLSIVTQEISERLHVSQARALAIFSDPRVRWDHRLVSVIITKYCCCLIH